MHNMVLWDLNELHAVQNSSIYDEAIEHKEQAKKEFLALKPALDHFPHLFGEVKLGDFMHASALGDDKVWEILKCYTGTQLWIYTRQKHI
jgi:hypothetical protein